MRTLAATLLSIGAPYAGVVLSSELHSAGMSRGQVRALAEGGWLTVIRRGAYLVGGQQPGDWQQLVAAYRVAGPNAVVSHWSAARAHRLPLAAGSFPPELTIVRGGIRRMVGVRTHIERIPPEQIEVVRGLRTTTRLRTLLDVASRLDVRALESIIDEELIAGHWTLDDLAAGLAAAPRSAGLAPLRDLARDRIGPFNPTGTDSHLELRVARVLAPCGPFETQFQVVIEGQVLLLDIAWPDLLVAVESEGWHVRAKSRSKFDRERRKLNLLTAHGWVVFRVTADMSDDEIRATVIPALMAASRRVGGT